MILKGEVVYHKKSKSIVYRPFDSQLQLEMSDTSSMVSEISPITAFLKYVVRKEADFWIRKYMEPEIKPSSVIFIEEPEAHLHPKGQSHIGYFLAVMALAGVQVIVETHSEHVLNGIRIAALKNAMKPKDISISFFSVNTCGMDTSHKVENIKLNERMDLETWPEGFLDQEEEDLRILRELRRR